MKLLTALVAGLIFGLGLLLSGMSNPAKVIGFLDLAGNWDPSLVFVMVGAIAVASIGFAFAKKRTTSLLNLPMQIPGNKRVDQRLVFGSALFGIGWGLAGICPGPSLVLLGMGIGKGALFFVAMLASMGIFEFVLQGNRKSASGKAASHSQ